MRLIRSKGVGVYFVTQNPLDVPDTVLGQLGNRVQHALRAFTPRDQKAVKAAAETMRANPKLDTAAAITELGVGEALISLLDEKGRPTMVERAFVLPPASRIGPITPEERRTLMTSSPVAGVYDKAVDRESAYERLRGRAEQAATPAGAGGRAGAPAGGGFFDSLKGSLGGLMTGSGRKDSMVEAMAKSAARTVGSTVGPRDRPRRARVAAGREQAALRAGRGHCRAPHRRRRRGRARRADRPSECADRSSKRSRRCSPRRDRPARARPRFSRASAT